jgi:GABA permease
MYVLQAGYRDGGAGLALCGLSAVAVFLKYAFLWDATRRAAQERLDGMLEGLRAHGVEATGALGDYRPWVALREAVAEVEPDLVIISTHARGESTWLRKDLVSTARRELAVPVRHVVPSQVDASA